MAGRGGGEADRLYVCIMICTLLHCHSPAPDVTDRPTGALPRRSGDWLSSFLAVDSYLVIAYL